VDPRLGIGRLAFLALAALLVATASRGGEVEDARARLVDRPTHLGAPSPPLEEPPVRLFVGIGMGYPTLSVELNVEGRWWFAGAQLAFATATHRRGLVSYAGVRGGVFLLDAPLSPFVAAGLGGLGESDLDTSRTEGWGVSGEVGLALRRDEAWFRPQLACQVILPFAQHDYGVLHYQADPVVLFAFRLLL
jgi:hypothetical protein